MSYPRNPSNPHLSSSMAMKRVSTIFRSPSSPAGPSSGEKSPAVEDDDSVNTEIADVKSQQTAVTVALPPPNLKIKVRPTMI